MCRRIGILRGIFCKIRQNGLLKKGRLLICGRSVHNGVILAEMRLHSAYHSVIPAKAGIHFVTLYTWLEEDGSPSSRG